MNLRACQIQKIKKGSRVLMRVDFNVPIKNGRVLLGADFRLRAVVDDVKALSKQGVKVILITHLGRPEGRIVKELSTKALVKRFSYLLKQDVKYVNDITGKKAQKSVEKMQDGDVLLLENLRFDVRERKNSRVFAKELASFGDLYINNAFGVCHRKHSSVHAITKKLPSCAGSIVLKEVEELSKDLEHPFVLLLGGIKLKTKIALLKKLAPKAKAVLLGSGVATVLHNVKTGGKAEIFGRKINREEIIAAKKVLKDFSSKLIFPIDVIMTRSKTAAHARSVPLKILEASEMAIDLSEHSIELYSRILAGAKSIVWNGPVGVVELAAGQMSTLELAKILAKHSKARTILGGGDTVTFLEQHNLHTEFDFVSTGGGAMLAFLAGEAMPGLDVLKK